MTTYNVGTTDGQRVQLGDYVHQAGEDYRVIGRVLNEAGRPLVLYLAPPGDNEAVYRAIVFESGYLGQVRWKDSRSHARYMGDRAGRDVTRPASLETRAWLERERRLMQDPTTWPNPYLPLARRHNRVQQIGLLMYLGGPVQPIVHVGNVFTPETEYLEYRDFLELQDAGWRVYWGDEPPASERRGASI